MDPAVFSLILLLGPLTGWSSVYFLSGPLLRCINDIQEMFRIRRLVALVGGLIGLTTSIFVLHHEAPIPRQLTVPISVLFGWGAFGALLLAAAGIGLSLNAWQHRCTLPTMKVIKHRR